MFTMHLMMTTIDLMVQRSYLSFFDCNADCPKCIDAKKTTAEPIAPSHAPQTARDTPESDSDENDGALLLDLDGNTHTELVGDTKARQLTRPHRFDFCYCHSCLHLPSLLLSLFHLCCCLTCLHLPAIPHSPLLGSPFRMGTILRS
jgi:hypothetical protein